MAKLTISTIAGSYASVAALNAAFDAIEAAIENTLSRDGTSPNAMAADLDMDSNEIVNLGPPSTGSSAARLVDIQSASIVTEFPSQSGNADRIMKTDGTVPSWVEMEAHLGDLLSAAADKLPYFDSASTMALTDITSFARTFLAIADGTTFLQTCFSDLASATPALTDELAISDVSLTPDNMRKCTINDLLKLVNSLTADTSPDVNADFLLAYDTSAGDVKKVKPIYVGAPTGAVIDYAGTSAPTGWLFCYGQAISRTTYADLFTALGTTYGVGDGSTTFNLPDLRGRVVAGKDDMGGSSANRLTDAGTGSLDGDVLGDSGGEETHTLTTTEMPAHTHSGTPIKTDTATVGSAGFMGGSSPANGSSLAVASQGGNGAHNNVQPTFILNKIIKT